MATTPKFAITVVSIAVVFLAGCVAAPESVETPAVVEPVAPPTAQPDSNDREKSVEEQPASVPDGCEGASGLIPKSNDDPGRVYGYIVTRMIDSGPTENASGTTVFNDAGDPAAYIVAEGDTPYAIAERLCFGHDQYLGWINSVRRNGSWSLIGDDGEFVLYSGDTLNLDAHTIASVGDEGGVVYSNTPDFHIPPL